MESVSCWFCGKNFEIDDPSAIEDCPHCHNGTNLLSKNGVLFTFDNQQIYWKNKRTPALGWEELTIIEALADSAKILIGMQNIPKAMMRINEILKLTRNEITKQKRTRKYADLLQRCEYRETNRTRCNVYPTIGKLNGLNLCKHHFKFLSK